MTTPYCATCLPCARTSGSTRVCWPSSRWRTAVLAGPLFRSQARRHGSRRGSWHGARATRSSGTATRTRTWTNRPLGPRGRRQADGFALPEGLGLPGWRALPGDSGPPGRRARARPHGRRPRRVRAARPTARGAPAARATRPPGGPRTSGAAAKTRTLSSCHRRTMNTFGRSRRALGRAHQDQDQIGCCDEDRMRDRDEDSCEQADGFLLDGLGVPGRRARARPHGRTSTGSTTSPGSGGQGHPGRRAASARRGIPKLPGQRARARSGGRHGPHARAPRALCWKASACPPADLGRAPAGSPSRCPARGSTSAARRRWRAGTLSQGVTEKVCVRARRVLRPCQPLTFDLTPEGDL